MTSKTQIAVLVAALFLGAQAGIAALEQDPSIVAAESAEPAQEQQAEATEPTATEAPEVAAAIEQPEAVSEAPAAAPGRVVERSDVFPRSTDDKDMLPALAAYLEMREAFLSTLVARGDVFPPSTDDKEMLPALAAYLDRREATLVARAQPLRPESAAAAADDRQLTAPIALGLHQQAVGTSN